MKIELPLVNGVITSIPSHANFLSIALQDDKGYEWLCNYYVNIYVKYNQTDWIDSCKASFIDWGLLDKNYSNLVKSYFVPRFLVPDLKEMIIKSLRQKYYINLRLDQFYIPCCGGFHKSHNHHNTLINGIDKDKSTVYISDFYNGNRYQTYEVSFDDVLRAYKNVEESQIPQTPDYQFFRSEIQLLKLNQDCYFEFSLVHLIQLLYDYRDGRDSTGRFFNSAYLFSSYDKKSETKYVYGIDCLEIIGELFCQGRLAIQNVLFLYDRYSAMVLRLEYLQKKYCIDLTEELYEYTSFREESILLQNLCIKYIYTKKESTTNTIKSKLAKMKTSESRIITQLIQKLEVLL